jgi:acetoin utilization deacetylase AcuC-like enzyme
MPVLWSPATRHHDPDGGVWVGVRIRDEERPERVDRILDALTDLGAVPREVATVADEELAAVHTAELVAFLREAWPAWEASGYLDDPGMNRVVAYAWPHPDLRPLPSRPASASAWAGQYATDTMTLVGPGSWDAIAAAASTALAGADHLVAGGRAAYALARPPGHHAGTSFYGGSCYLNNAALAADRLSSIHAEVAVVDLDAHHGNGTQQILWDRSGTRYGSVHVDPARGWYPHYVGHATETGGPSGTVANLPLPPGTGDGPWLEAVERLASFAAGADALVVSLGVDAAGSDPESPLEVTRDGFAAAGGLLGAMGIPTVVVQEGGYVLDTIGDLVAAFLVAFEGASP